MIHSKMWLVVKPTVGIPLMLGSVAIAIRVMRCGHLRIVGRVRQKTPGLLQNSCFAGAHNAHRSRRYGFGSLGGIAHHQHRLT